MKRKVVVTGMGMVSSLGSTMAASWKALLRGASGVAKIDKDPLFSGVGFGKIPKYAARINPDEEWVKKQREKKLFSKSFLYLPLALATADAAMKDSKLLPKDLSEEEKDRFGVAIGSTMGGASDNGSSVEQFSIPHALGSCANAFISNEYHLRGHSIVTAMACTSGLHAIGEGYLCIKNNQADCMLVGGIEHAVNPVVMEEFSSYGILSTGCEEAVTKASRPFDQRRDGSVIGDGAGFLILEDYERAKRRGAHIYCQIKGYGGANDTYHMTNPNPEGTALYRAAVHALAEAGITPSGIDLVSSHGAGTKMGDPAEVKALERLFGDPKLDDLTILKNRGHIYKKFEIDRTRLRRVSVAAHKGNIGNTLGASGAMETIFSILSMEEGVVPYVLNLESPISPDLGFVRRENQKRKIKSVLKNTIGLGGVNASLVFGTLEE